MKARIISDGLCIHIENPYTNRGLWVHPLRLQNVKVRWLNEGEDNEQFQVYWNRSWWNANSIDFEDSII